MNRGGETPPLGGRSADEIALASALLDLRSADELEQFLGGLLRRVGYANRAFARSGTGRKLAEVLKDVGSRIIPAFDGPAADPDPRPLGLEVEGLSAEDREFELAKAFVRFADTATHLAARAPRTMPSAEAARHAAVTAARRHLPGLLTDDTQQRSTTMNRYETQELENFEAEGGELENLEWETQEWENQEWESEDRESQEMELVNELLETTDEQELEEFLGKLFSRAAKAVGGAISSPVGQALTGTLKNIARRALPIAGGTLGNMVFPGAGGLIGSKLGSMASKLFELELETMDEQEAEYEVAKRFVRLASTAARHAARAPRSAPAGAVTKAAVITAARRHAPGLLRGAGGKQARPQRGRRGRGPAPSTIWAYGTPPGGCPRCDGEPAVHDHRDGDVRDHRDDDNDAPADGDLSSEVGGSGSRGRQQSGRWVRRGRKIMIMDV